MSSLASLISNSRASSLLVRTAGWLPDILLLFLFSCFLFHHKKMWLTAQKHWNLQRHLAHSLAFHFSACWQTDPHHTAAEWSCVICLHFHTITAHNDLAWSLPAVISVIHLFVTEELRADQNLIQKCCSPTFKVMKSSRNTGWTVCLDPIILHLAVRIRF